MAGIKKVLTVIYTILMICLVMTACKSDTVNSGSALASVSVSTKIEKEAGDSQPGPVSTKTEKNAAQYFISAGVSQQKKLLPYATADIIEGKADYAVIPQKNTPKDTSSEYKTALIGHRGYSDKYVENTAPAFKGAYKNGFDGIEFDVYQTKSGALLVFHDRNLKRMCGVKKNIWDLTKKTRKKYKINGKYHIPTLKRTLRIAKKHKGPILLHLKDYPKYGYRPDSSGVKRIAGLIKKQKLEKRVIVFDYKDNIKRFAGKYGLQYGIYTSSEDIDQIKKEVQWVKDNKMTMFMFIHMSALESKGEEKVKLVHDSGLKAGVYFTNTKKEMERLNELEVDYGMSNYKLY